ncbi:MAG: TIGR03009 domain-containing protein [Planctomycetia bacterium]|nr:TIGR03009 domain-containing protein [Planctomycetia bacterium]
MFSLRTHGTTLATFVAFALLAADAAGQATKAPRTANPPRPQPSAGEAVAAEQQPTPGARAAAPRRPTETATLPNTAAPQPVTKGAPAAAKAAPGAKKVVPVQFQQTLPQLSPEQQAELDHILDAWERESDKVKTLSAGFNLFEYDSTFGPAPGGAQNGPPKATRQVAGAIHFAAPDKGSYQIGEGHDEHWVCDGQAIYEFDAKNKKLIEHRLPKELQGKAITNGPLPFVFGAKAGDMKQRHFMRVITPVDANDEIWIEAWPRTQQDAANFDHVQVILDTKTMLPKAVKLFLPNPKNYKVYVFSDTKMNGPWAIIKSFFSRPATPWGWERVVEQAPDMPPTAGPGPATVRDPRGQPAQRPPTAAADARSQPASRPAKSR